MVVVGADVHKRTHTFVAVDETGRELGGKTFQASPVSSRAWPASWPSSPATNGRTSSA
jgi:hypothetical protein